MDHLNELIAENLKDIRKGKGLSLEQVSSLTTISKSMLSSWKEEKSILRYQQCINWHWD